MRQGKQSGGASKPGADQDGTSFLNVAELAQTTGSDATAAEPAAPLAPGLYVVATAIGNVADMTLRALATLRAADAVACEDTRVTTKLLSRYGIAAKLLPYHEHNAAAMRPKLLARLHDGARIALVSDAGTPLVSDPGYKLVREAIAAGINVVPVPGPSAPLTALVVSGLPSDRFLFAGFLPSKSAARRASLAELAAVPATLIFFEAAQRLTDSLEDMAAVLGDRPAAVARELTKMFEETRRGTLTELAAHYREAGPPKGEIVIVVGAPTAASQAASAADLDEALKHALATSSVKDAAATVTAATGLPRKQVYARALALMAERKE